MYGTYEPSGKSGLFSEQYETFMGHLGHNRGSYVEITESAKGFWHNMGMNK
jgi:hypothetical protein